MTKSTYSLNCACKGKGYFKHEAYQDSTGTTYRIMRCHTCNVFKNDAEAVEFSATRKAVWFEWFLGFYHRVLERAKEYERKHNDNTKGD